MNRAEKSSVKLSDKHNKIIEAGQNGKSLFLENLAQTEVQRKVQEQQENPDEAKHPEKKRRSKKRKSSSKKCKRANSTANKVSSISMFY